jgi:hypothetical protein
MKIIWIKPDPVMQDDIAHEPGVIQAVNKVAREKAAIAKGYLAAHRYEGHSSIEVSRGEVDSFVSLTDRRSRSNNYAAAAAAIEFGRSGDSPSQGVRALSRAFGLTSGPRRRRNSGRAGGRPGG